jgi:hypothetical protein
MDWHRQIRELLELKAATFVLYHDNAVSAEAICASVRTCTEKPVSVGRLHSDYILPDDGTFIREALLSGRLLLLIAPDAKKLPASLLRDWESFQKDPRHPYSKPQRYIHFSLADAKCELGTLGLILPKGYKLNRRYWTVRVNSTNQVGALSQLDEVRELGREAVSLSMKTLCFLHHRDPEDIVHHSSLAEIWDGQRPLTWRDLQRILRDKPDERMQESLERLGKEGRATVEQLNLSAAAISYLREERREREQIGSRWLAPSIYHLLWIHASLENDGHVFRGQRDSRWRQDTTLLRADPDGGPPTLETIVQRLHRTQAFLQALAADEQHLVGRALDDDERLAVAQHYGMPTGLLDYTRSLAIAAFFATGAGDPGTLREGDIGVIYYVSADDPVASAPPRIPARFDLAHATGLSIGRLRAIEPALPDPENRIARQRGVFIEGFDSRDLQRLSIGVLYFRQRPGETFEDPRLGLTRERLLNPNAKLQQLADRVTFEPPRLPKRLTAVRLPSDNVFGSLGLNLYTNLYRAQTFLDDLAVQAEQVEPGLWPALRAILERHISEARISARTADVAASSKLETRVGPRGITYILDDVEVALEELAVLGGLQRRQLADCLRRNRPRLGPDMNPVPVDGEMSPVLPKLLTTKIRVVTSVGLFIVGLEYLRTVWGNIAEDYFTKAFIQLRRATSADGIPPRERG